MTFHTLKRGLTATLCAALIWTSPGLGVHSALAQTFSSARGAKTGPAPRITAPLGVKTGIMKTGGSILKTGLSGSLPGVNAPIIDRAAPGASASVALPSPVPVVAESIPTVPGAIENAVKTVSEVQGTGKIIGNHQRIQTELGKSRDISKKSAAFAFGSGRRLIDLITRKKSLHGDGNLSVQARNAGEGSGSSHGLGRSRSVRFPDGSSDGIPSPETQDSPKRPLLPRIIASVLGALPAALIGLPLVLAGSFGIGGIVIAASIVVSAMPFLTESAPAIVRSLPGAALLTLGLTSLAAGVMGGAVSALVIGPVAALGGYALWRFGTDKAKWAGTTQGQLAATYIGAVAATAAAGLVLFSPATWAVTLSGALAFASMGLYIHLPGWIGRGMKSTLNGYLTSFMGVYSVLTALRTDTLRFRRFLDMSKASLERSPWNALTLGVLWIPTVIMEAVQAVAAVAAGLVIGTVQAPINFLWGASYKVDTESRVTKFFAGWARLMHTAQQGSKNSIFDPLTSLFRRAADSADPLVSLFGALGMRFTQTLWLTYALAVSPIVTILGIGSGITETGHAYDENRHAPWSLSWPKLGRTPEQGTGAATALSPFIPKVVAAIAALGPLYFFGHFLMINAPFLGWAFWPATLFYVGATLATAALPLKSPAGLPKWMLVLPGLMLGGAGVFTALNGQALVLGIVAALSGFALADYLENLSEPGARRKHNDHPAFIGAYVGALAMIFGLGAALVGLTGILGTTLTVLAFATSPLLLYHLPAYLWRGLGYAFSNASRSVKKIFSRLSFREEEVEFEKHIVGWYGYHLEKSGWNAVWMAFSVWPVHLALKLIRWTIAGVSGALLGLMRAPVHFLWGLFYEIDPSLKTTRFLGGFSRRWYQRMEGSDAMRFGQAWTRAMNAHHPKKRLPTFKAFLALFGARAVQALWLLYIAAMATVLSPVALVMAALGGIKAASGPYQATKAEEVVAGNPSEGDPTESDPKAPGAFALR